MTQTYIVSGAASGIGRHMAGVLFAAGHNLVLTDINAAGLESFATEHGCTSSPRVHSVVMDARDAAGWRALVDDCIERFGSLDMMLNIAGYLKPGLVEATDSEDVDRHMDINAKGVMYATQAGAAVMVRAGRGHIVNVASLAGVAPIAGLALYSASKHAVRGYSLAAGMELRARGVHVSVVCPDAVETPMLQLQERYDEAAMTFSGGRGLTLHEVEVAILDVLRHKPLERLLPLPRSGRALAAQLGGLFPGLASKLTGVLRARGQKVQAER